MATKEKFVPKNKRKFNLYRWFFFRSRGDSPFLKLVIHVILIGVSFISLYPALRVMTVSLRGGNSNLLLTTDLDLIPTGRVRTPNDFDSGKLMLLREKTQEDVQNNINELISSDVERNSSDVKNNLAYLSIQKLGGKVDGYKDLKDFVDNSIKLSSSELNKKLSSALGKVTEKTGSDAQSAVDDAFPSKRNVEERILVLPSKTKVTLQVPAAVTDEEILKVLVKDTSEIIKDQELDYRYSKKKATFKVPQGATKEDIDLVMYKTEILYEKKVKLQFSGKEITLYLAKTNAKKQAFKESNLEDILYKTPAELQVEMDKVLKAKEKLGTMVISKGTSIKIAVPRNLTGDDIQDVVKNTVRQGTSPARFLSPEGAFELALSGDINVKGLENALDKKSKESPGYVDGIPKAEAYFMLRDFPESANEVMEDFPVKALEGDNPAFIQDLLEKQIRVNKNNQKDQQVFARFVIDGKPIMFTDADGKPTDTLAVPYNLGAGELQKDLLYKVSGAQVQSFNTATLNNYSKILFDKDSDFMLWIWNSLLITISTAFLGVALASTSAYAFSRFSFPGRKAGLIFLLTTQMIPGAMLMLPIYVLAKNLGLIGTWSGLVVAYSVGSIPFSVWILKGYYDTIPKELEEAATIDGATKMQTFFKIMLPLAAPALAIVFLFNFMQAWNDYMLARIMLPEETTHTWPLGLTKLQGQFNTQWGTFSAAALMVSIPVVALFLASSKYLVSGLTLGSVKG